VGSEEDLPHWVAPVDYVNHKVFGLITKDVPDEARGIGMATEKQPITLPNDQLSQVFTKSWGYPHSAVESRVSYAPALSCPPPAVLPRPGLDGALPPHGHPWANLDHAHCRGTACRALTSVRRPPRTTNDEEAGCASLFVSSC
jgi:hypothetical protein